MWSIWHPVDGRNPAPPWESQPISTGWADFLAIYCMCCKFPWPRLVALGVVVLLRRESFTKVHRVEFCHRLTTTSFLLKLWWKRSCFLLMLCWNMFEHNIYKSYMSLYVFGVVLRYVFYVCHQYGSVSETVGGNLWSRTVREGQVQVALTLNVSGVSVE